MLWVLAGAASAYQLVAAQLIGPQAAIAVTGLAGLVAAAVLAGTWRRVHGRAGHPAPW